VLYGPEKQILVQFHFSQNPTFRDASISSTPPVLAIAMQVIEKPYCPIQDTDFKQAIFCD
jgi:hypothetical protein